MGCRAADGVSIFGRRSPAFSSAVNENTRAISPCNPVIADSAPTPVLEVATDDTFQLVSQPDDQVPKASDSSMVTSSVSTEDVDGEAAAAFISSTPVGTSCELMNALISSTWQNPINPWDANGDGVLNPVDELVVTNGLSVAEPRRLPVTVPAGSSLVDANGDGAFNGLHILAIHQDFYVVSSALPSDTTPVAALPAPAATPTPTLPNDLDLIAAALAPSQQKPKREPDFDQTLAATVNWRTL